MDALMNWRVAASSLSDVSMTYGTLKTVPVMMMSMMMMMMVMMMMLLIV